MPIPLTKLNKVLELHKDLSNNSYIYNQYILTCDISDTQYLDNGTVRSNRIYINNRADYLIHPFSTVTNCVTKFNNEKSIYQYKKPIFPNPSTVSAWRLVLLTTGTIITRRLSVDTPTRLSAFFSARVHRPGNSTRK